MKMNNFDFFAFVLQNSSEKESTDLRSTSPVSAKRSLDEVAALEATPEQPAAKKTTVITRAT